MLNREVIILAGGQQTRWGVGGVGCLSKHFVSVPWNADDEFSRRLPLLDRTFSLLDLWNHDARSNLGCGIENSTLVRPGAPLAQWPWVAQWWSTKCTSWGDAAAEAMLNLPVKNRRVVLLLGDVYWTWPSLRSILETETFVGVATDDWDVFGLSFDDDTFPAIERAVRRGGRYRGTIRNELTEDLGDGWGRVMCADWTQDFDIDWEHAQFLAGLSKNHHFCNTPDQVRRRRAMGMRPRKRGHK
jgi:hypothetical protein